MEKTEKRGTFKKILKGLGLVAFGVAAGAVVFNKDIRNAVVDKTKQAGKWVGNTFKSLTTKKPELTADVVVEEPAEKRYNTGNSNYQRNPKFNN